MNGTIDTEVEHDICTGREKTVLISGAEIEAGGNLIEGSCPVDQTKTRELGRNKLIRLVFYP